MKKKNYCIKLFEGSAILLKNRQIIINATEPDSSSLILSTILPKPVSVIFLKSTNHFILGVKSNYLGED